VALTESYLISVKNVAGIFQAIQEAGVPEKFTNEFLKTLGFGSSSDRTIIGILKSLKFLDESGRPTEIYRKYKDRTTAKNILGKQIKEAYEDVFLANEKAEQLPTDKIKGIIAAKTGKSDSVVEKMASTFKTLCTLAIFSDTEIEKEKKTEDEHLPINKSSDKSDSSKENNFTIPTSPTFHYNIQIHLPVTKDISVYNAIFKSLREHLL